jgi:FtsK/SpoIIIE family
MFWYDSSDMLTSQERMEVFLDVLERVAPGMRGRAMNDMSLQFVENKASLQELLARIGPLPPCSALIGVCEDGLPFLLDLADPSPGSILVVADEHSGKTGLLRAILASASALNPPEQVSFTVLAPNPGEYDVLYGLEGNCYVLSTFDRAASELVVEMAELASQRINGRNRGPFEILAIDDLAAFVQNNDYEVNCYLKWLIAHGPRGSVWPIAAIKTSQLWRIRDGIYETFGTFFIGRTSSYQLLSEADSAPARTEIPGVFTAQIDDEWMRFWIPEVG